ncbi:MAG TPA: type II toxin-antitoxin system Phd/YefM family antitoxin [Baekduia sp.]|nr:type II toxin-antitoxin system Phd/YefM family antitoxin [Baekduia sp.]
MAEISATDASKRFADVLDAVEHRGETFTVVRRGRPVATVTPAKRSTLRDLREVLADRPLDDDFGRDVGDGLLAIDQAPRDSWND